MLRGISRIRVLASSMGVSRVASPSILRNFNPATLKYKSFSRTYASSASELDKRLEQIYEAIKNTPELQQAVKDLKEGFEAKGITPGSKPSMLQMSMLLMDKKISTSLKVFYEELQKANISCSPDDLKGLLSIYNKQK